MKVRIKSALNYKKPAFWIVAVAVVACIVVVVCFLTNLKDDELCSAEPFGHSYRVENIAYNAPQYSFIYTTDNTPLYWLTVDYQLLIQEQGDDFKTALGHAAEIILTEDNFDRYFTPNGSGNGWNDGFSAAKVRRHNLKAWRLIVPNDSNGVFYYILQQKSGDVYLTYGYYDAEGEIDPYSDDSSIRWLFKLAAENSLSVGPNELIINDGYVTSSCLYMNFLSSYMGLGDSGYWYQITEDAFIIMNRSTGSIERISPVEWAWQEFPYTDDEWYHMYVPEGYGMESISEVYSEILYQPISERYCLLKADGQLWLVEIHNNQQMGEYIWSIYTIEPEIAKGSAQWQSRLLSSQYPTFRFEFDMPYTEINAVCTEGGSLIGYDDYDGSGYPQGAQLTIPAGSALYWTPLTGETYSPSVAENTYISFTIHDDNTMLYIGSIYITGENTQFGTLTQPDWQATDCLCSRTRNTPAL